MSEGTFWRCPGYGYQSGLCECLVEGSGLCEDCTQNMEATERALGKKASNAQGEQPPVLDGEVLALWEGDVPGVGRMRLMPAVPIFERTPRWEILRPNGHGWAPAYSAAGVAAVELARKLVALRAENASLAGQLESSHETVATLRARVDELEGATQPSARPLALAGIRSGLAAPPATTTSDKGGA